MKKISSLAILLAVVMLCCFAFSGCRALYSEDSYWVSEGGNVVNENNNNDNNDDNNSAGDNNSVANDNAGSDVSNGGGSNTSSTGGGATNNATENSSSGGSGGATNVSTNKKNYLDDDLNDWSLVKGRGANLMFDGNKPAMFEGDFSRVRRGNGNDCWISWEFEAGITEFGVVTYWDTTVRDITVSVSKDNKTWTILKDAKKSDISIGSDWTKRVFKFYGIDKANKYVKIDLGATPNGDHVHSPNISRIRINNIDSMDDPNRFLEGREATTFYIDAKNGSDNNSGTSQSKPLKSLNAISKRYFQPGDKILFKSGCSFNGSLTLNGMGTASKPIYVGTYGGDKKAKIAARGGTAVQIKMQYVTVENLEITNANGLIGIGIVPPITGENKDVIIRDCYIHEVNTKQENFLHGMYEHGGIIVTVDGLEPTWFDGLVFENNVIENTSRCGIFTTSNWAYRVGAWGREGHYKSDDDGWYPIENTVIRGNTINGCYGDSILVTCAKNTLIEKNTVVNGFSNTKVAGIACASVWCNNTNDSVFQYNDISYTKLPAGCADGEALDIDISNVRTVMQYNYTHDNEGGMLLICNSKDGAAVGRDHTVRFNLSVNDGSSAKAHAVIMVDGKNPGTHLYNNTIYMNGVTDMPVKQYCYSYEGTSDNFTFTNNIFYGVSGKTYKWPAEYGWKNCVFDNNVFVNTNVDALKKVSGVTVKSEKSDDVKFANASIDVKTAKRVDAIKAFTPTNKLRGATNISNNGGKDINGTKINKIDFYGCVKY